MALISGNTIKKELCRNCEIEPRHLGVRRGTGTARCWLDVRIANHLFRSHRNRIRQYLTDNRERLDIRSYDPDYQTDELNLELSVSNWNGVQLFEEERWDYVLPKPVKHNWKEEGF